MTREMVAKSFEIGKLKYLNKISLKHGVEILEQMGVNTNSARDYIYCYSHLIKGELFTRRINLYATEFYLQRIYEEDGNIGLQNALSSLSQHFDYWEDISGTVVKKGREIYTRFSKLAYNEKEEIIYPDELDSNQIYSEGKSKKVLVNAYERNPDARKKCIEHFGPKCQVCSFSFVERYGKLGIDFIHVHHKIDIAEIKEEYNVNPITDLIPVCPNCHAMLHRKKPAYTMNELKQLMN